VDGAGGSGAEVEAWAAGEAGGGRGRTRFREKMLVTHRGLSGPAVLQASSYWRSGDALHLDLAPELDVLRTLMEPEHGGTFPR